MTAKHLQRFLIIWALCWLGTPANAADLSITAFFGAFQGSGIAENADSLYFGTTVRDLDIIIGADNAGGAFFVRWTTVIRGGGDPNNPNTRRKTQNIVFNNTDQPGVFRGVGSGDLLSGKPYIWAQITGQTLTVYIMTIDQSGRYSMQSYARTLNAFGMDLVFRRLRDGEPVREASAKLTKR
jgi:hypothetical protein